MIQETLMNSAADGPFPLAFTFLSIFVRLWGWLSLDGQWSFRLSWMMAYF